MIIINLSVTGQRWDCMIDVIYGTDDPWKSRHDGDDELRGLIAG